MERNLFSRRQFLSLLGVTVLNLATRSRALAAEPICVVVSANARQKDLSLGELRRIFLNQPTDDANGNRFIPLNAPPKTPVRARFDQILFGVDPDEMARRWVDQRIRGVQPPRT